MTFLELQTRVGELINQGVTDDTKLVTETEVKANLNRAYQKLVNRVASLGQDFYLRLAKADLVDGQSLYGLPTDFRKLDRIEVGYSASTTRYKATRMDRNAINDPNWVFSQAQPYYAILGNMIELFPTPTENVTDGLWMWYLETVPDMSADADEPNVPAGYEDLPVEYAAGKAKMRQGLIDEGRELIAEFYNELERMTEEVVERVTDDSDSIIVRDTY